MQSVIGNLRKMKGVLKNPIEYQFIIGEHEILLNALLGKKIKMHFTGLIHCIHCGRKTNKSFQQGYCFPCLRRLNECNLCTIHPERCRVEEGACDANDWAHAHCTQKHIVYLANTSAIKVGITRETQQPTRWIDQGAKQALPIFQVSNRFQAGIIEVAIKKYVSDRTNWRQMLKQDADDVDLKSARDQLLEQAKEGIKKIVAQYQTDEIKKITDADIIEFSYPILEYPEKISSLSLDKTPEVEGVLRGIKGQYLILECGVINIRKFGGYEVAFEI